MRSQSMGCSLSFGPLLLLKWQPLLPVPNHFVDGACRTDVPNYWKFHRTDGNDSMKAQLCSRRPPNCSNSVLEWAVVVVNHTPSNADDNTDRSWTCSSGNAFHWAAVGAADAADANWDDDDGNLVTDWPNNRRDCMNSIAVVAVDLVLSLDHHWLASSHLELIDRRSRRRCLVPMTMWPMRMPSIAVSAADYHLNRLQPLRADCDDDFGYALVMKHYFRIEHRTHYKNCSCCCCRCCCWYCWRCWWRCWVYQRQSHCHYYCCLCFHVAQTTEEPMQPHSVFLRVPLFSKAPHTKIALSSSAVFWLRRFAHDSNIKNQRKKKLNLMIERICLPQKHALTALVAFRYFFFYSKYFFPDSVKNFLQFFLQFFFCQMFNFVWRQILHSIFKISILFSFSSSHFDSKRNWKKWSHFFVSPK